MSLCVFVCVCVCVYVCVRVCMCLYLCVWFTSTRFCFSGCPHKNGDKFFFPKMDFGIFFLGYSLKNSASKGTKHVFLWILSASAPSPNRLTIVFLPYNWGKKTFLLLLPSTACSLKRGMTFVNSSGLFVNFTNLIIEIFQKKWVFNFKLSFCKDNNNNF